MRDLQLRPCPSDYGDTFGNSPATFGPNCMYQKKTESVPRSMTWSGLWWGCLHFSFGGGKEEEEAVRTDEGSDTTALQERG